MCLDNFSVLFKLGMTLTIKNGGHDLGDDPGDSKLRLIRKSKDKIKTAIEFE